MTDPVPAIAIGLPAATSAFDRRSFLAKLAAAGVISGTALPADAADHPDATLFALGATIEEQREALRRAGARTDAAYERLQDAPELSPVCRFKAGDNNVWPIDKTFTHHQPDGRIEFRYWGSGEVASMLRVYLLNTADLAEPLAYFRSRAMEIVTAIEERDAAILRNEDAAGVTAANAAESIARRAIDATLLRIADIPARTLQGLIVKARAVAYSACDPQDREEDYLENAKVCLGWALAEKLADDDPRKAIKTSLHLDLTAIAFAAEAA